MPTETALLLGAGGHAKVVLSAARLAFPQTVWKIFDDAAHGTILGEEILGQIAEAKGDRAHIAIGDNAARERIASWARSQNIALLAICHPASRLAPEARIGDGAFVAAGAILAPQARLHEGAILNHNAIADHDCEIGAFAHVAPGAVLGGGVRIGARALIGAGAVVLPGRRIADDAIIGAGAVVTKDVPDAATWFGVPARNRHG